MTRIAVPWKSSLLVSSLLFSCAQGDTSAEVSGEAGPWIAAEAGLVPLPAGACSFNSTTKKLTITLQDGQAALLAAKATDLTVNGVLCAANAADNKLTNITGGIEVKGPLAAEDVKGVKVMVDFSTTPSLPVGTDLAAKIKVSLAGEPQDEVWFRTGKNADKVWWVQDVAATDGALSLSQNASTKKNRRDLDIVGAGSVSVFLGAEKDVFEGKTAKVPLRVYGDLGDDTIQTGEATDLVDGGAGSDVVYGGKGDDLMIGGADSDTLDGQEGCDGYMGGEGVDFVLDHEPAMSFDWVEGNFAIGQCVSEALIRLMPPPPDGAGGGSGDGTGGGTGGGTQPAPGTVTNRIIQSPSGASAAFSFSYVPAGTFTMGASPNDPEATNEERHPHPVTLTRPLLVSRTELTRQQASLFASPATTVPPEQQNKPAGIAWLSALDYLNALSQADGLTPVYSFTSTQAVWDTSANGYRLPTEAEWEYFARAGETGPRYGTSLNDVAWYGMTNTGGPGNTTTLQNVGLKLPNAWGLYDVLGNASEFVWDNYSYLPYPGAPPTTYDPSLEAMGYSAAAVTDPMGPLSSPFEFPMRHLRGGDIFNVDSYMRLSARSGDAEAVMSGMTTIRIVRHAP